MRSAKSILTVFLAFVLLAGCADGDGTGPNRQTIDGKIEILWDSATGLSARLHFVEPLQAAYPDAEFNYTNIWRHSILSYFSDGFWPFNQYDVVRTNLYADLIVFENTLAPFYFASGYLEPLDSFIPTDISIHEHLGPDLLERTREQGGGELYALPFGKNGYALYYNKEIIDAYQVPHPTDGMTWEEVLELARAIQDHPLNDDITGIGIPDPHLVFSQLGGRFTTPETGMPDFGEPFWDRYIEFARTMNAVGTTRYYTYRDFSEGKIAMVAGRYFGTAHTDGAGDTPTHQLMAPFAEWDMVSFPVFEDAPDTGPAPAYYYVGIPKNSLRKQEAFRLISHLLSDEAQLANSLNGVISIRSEPVFRERYGELHLRALGKHAEAFLWHSREASLGPDYDLYMQYHDPFDHFFYVSDRDQLERHYDYIREKLSELENNRLTWLDKTSLQEK